MTGTIEALGLIYTNVEAKESPTGQRGFQVWQASAGLSAEARKEVSRRVDDYRLPTGTTAEAAAAFTRDAFFKLTDKAGGGFAVARSVPLTGKDKFGRGGRFLAHVLVVSAADFAGLGCDPFAVFDAATFYCGEPEQLAKDHPEWVKGVLPVTPLTPVPTPGPCHPGPVRAKLAGHVDRDAALRKTVVVVGKPADVATELRAIYRGLPAALRAAAEFDTMSAGASLTQVPCAFAGCPAADALKMWAFRRFVRFDPAAGSFTPPSELQAPLYPLRAALPGTEAWAEATDAARAAGWAVAAAIETGEVAAAATALEAEGGSAALAILEGVPEFGATLERAKRDWLARCPAAVAAVPGVAGCLDEHLAVPLAQRLGRLREGLPRARLADIVLHEIAMKAYRGGDGDPLEVLRHIQEWHGKEHGAGSAGRRLDWVLSRLRGRDADELGVVLSTGADDDAAWFRTWVREYAEAVGLSAAKLCEGLPHHLEDDEIDRRHLYDAELYLQCQPNEPADVLTDLRFRHACRTGGLAGLIERDDLPERGECLAYFRTRSALGWTVLSDGTYFAGAFAYPSSLAEADLLRAVSASGVSGRHAIPLLFPAAARNPSDALPRRSETPMFVQSFLDQLGPSKGKPADAGKLEASRKEFVRSGEVFYREAARHVIDALIREPHTEYEPGESTREPALFGLRLKWIDQNVKNTTQLANLLELVLGPSHALDRTVLPPAELRDRDPANFARLLSWM